MLRRRSLTCIALFALLGGCAGSSPSEADAREVLEKNSAWSRGIQEGAIKVISFKKVDGQTMEIYGVKHYEMDYVVQLQVLKDSSDGWTVSGGKTRTYAGRISFEKTEKGWRGESGGWKYKGP